MLGKKRRVALLAEGSFNVTDAKTAVGVLRYRPEEVVAVIDRARAGRTSQDCTGIGGDIPVVASLDAAAALNPDTLLLGTSPQGGELPSSWRAVIVEALLRGWDVLAGLHEFLGDDRELAALADAQHCRIIDTRRPPQRRPLAARRASSVEPLIVLTVGSDCNVGKMTTALEIRSELEQKGIRTAFVATGQTGIFVADQGIAIDAVPSDFVAGFVEEMVLDAAQDAEVVMVEGQGALQHPAYSGVSLSLMHGACPDVMVLCHVAGRTHMRVSDAAPSPKIRSLADLARDNERAASWVKNAHVAGIALNTMLQDDKEAKRTLEHTARVTGLPVVDPVRFGAEPLAVAVMRAMEEKKRRAAAS